MQHITFSKDWKALTFASITRLAVSRILSKTWLSCTNSAESEMAENITRTYYKDFAAAIL